jgi:hypothetical protein
MIEINYDYAMKYSIAAGFLVMNIMSGLYRVLYSVSFLNNMCVFFSTLISCNGHF